MRIFDTNEELKHLRRSDFVFDQFDKERIQEISNILADHKNSMIFLTSQTFEDETLPLKEKWFNIDYSVAKYSDA